MPTWVKPARSQRSTAAALSFPGRQPMVARGFLPLLALAVNYCSTAKSQLTSFARHSKNKDLAHAYINLALGRKAQKDFVEEVYWGPTNKTVEVSPKARERAVIGEDAVKKLINPDWDYLVTVRSEWTDWWDKNMGK